MKNCLKTCCVILSVLILSNIALAQQQSLPPTLKNASQNSSLALEYGLEFLKPFSADYTAFRSGKDIGSAKLSLEKRENQQYELRYQSKVSRFFLSDKRFETTLFAKSNNELIPLSYEYKRTGTGPNKALAVTFNAVNNTIVINNEDTLEWNGELDNQLFRLDLPTKLSQGISKTGYDFINYRGEKRHYELEVVANENLNLPYGQIETIKVKINRESNKRVTYAWFAPSLNFNLVRLQQFKDNKEQGDMQLSSFSYL